VQSNTTTFKLKRLHFLPLYKPLLIFSSGGNFPIEKGVIEFKDSLLSRSYYNFRHFRFLLQEEKLLLPVLILTIHPRQRFPPSTTTRAQPSTQAKKLESLQLQSCLPSLQLPQSFKFQESQKESKKTKKKKKTWKK